MKVKLWVFDTDNSPFNTKRAYIQKSTSIYSTRKTCESNNKQWEKKLKSIFLTYLFDRRSEIEFWCQIPARLLLYILWGRISEFFFNLSVKIVVFLILHTPSRKNTRTGIKNHPRWGLKPRFWNRSETFFFFFFFSW